MTRPFRIVLLSLASFGLLGVATEALAQDAGGGRPGGAGGPPPLPAPGQTPPPAESGGDASKGAEPAKAEGTKPAAGAVDEMVEVRGNRFKIRLKRGSVIHGILPKGLFWERQDLMGDYEPSKKGADGAGLRIQYVLGMDGDIFVLERDIAEIEDMGALSEEDRARIRERILADRRKIIEERERALRSELDRIRDMASEHPDGEGTGEAVKPEGDGSGMTEEEKAGEALLEEFPPTDWGPKRKSEILQAQTNGIFPNDREVIFLRSYSQWEKALERRRKLEAEKADREAREAAEKALRESSGGTETGNGKTGE